MSSKSTQPSVRRATPAQGNPVLSKEKRQQLIDEAAKRATESQALVVSTPEAAPAKPAVRRVEPWIDLPADPSKGQKQPREKTVFSCALAIMASHESVGGATLEEIKESFKPIGMFHHDPKRLLVYMSKEKGWGFVMNPANGRIRPLLK